MLQRKSYRHITRFTLIFAAIFAFSQCSVMNTNSSGKASRGLFTSFFVGDDGTQYFIKPLEFDGVEGGDELLIDFTFRHRDEVTGDARLNTSLLTPDLVKEIDSVKFRNTAHTVVTKTSELMFNQRQNSNIESRHEVYLPLADMNQLFGNPDWEIIFYYSGKQRSFKADKRTRKKINALNHDIFELF